LPISLGDGIGLDKTGNIYISGGLFRAASFGTISLAPDVAKNEIAFVAKLTFRSSRT
jgi:hypothetical protein